MKLLIATLTCTLCLSVRAQAQPFALPWYTMDGGGAMNTTGGTFALSGTTGQPDAGAMTGGSYSVAGGFWPAAALGVPASTVTAAVLRKPNSAGPSGQCDLPVDLAVGGTITSDPRNGRITELRIAFDVQPRSGGTNPVTIEEDATCPSPPSFGSYTGASAVSAVVAGNELVLTFSPALENARTYRITLGPGVTSIAGQAIEVRGLIGDVNHNGQVNANDRSVVIGVWTAPGGFSCVTDLNSSGATNGNDRSVVIGAWTGTGTNCAP